MKEVIGNATLYLGDVRNILEELPDETVHCCVTSPPYWGLRDYGFDGQIGLEPTPGEYVNSIISVCQEIRRILRDDGTLWLNLGDSYATGAGKVGDHPGGGEQGKRWTGNHPGRANQNVGRGTPSRADGRGDHVYLGPPQQPNRMPQKGLKPKDLVGIPWRVAFALQADGWYLRSDIIWHKPNPMPESVTDRPTKSHEYIFLLSKSQKYHYDHEAIKEPAQDWGTRNRVNSSYVGHEVYLGGAQTITTGVHDCKYAESGRNKRSVWSVATRPYAGAHFATFPQKLIEPCILAGCPSGGVVLDPFSGSGTTAVVAHNLGRKSIMIEANPDYYALARERIYQAQRQGTLFWQLK